MKKVVSMLIIFGIFLAVSVSSVFAEGENSTDALTISYEINGIPFSLTERWILNTDIASESMMAFRIDGNNALVIQSEVIPDVMKIDVGNDAIKHKEDIVDYYGISADDPSYTIETSEWIQVNGIDYCDQFFYSNLTLTSGERDTRIGRSIVIPINENESVFRIMILCNRDQDFLLLDADVILTSIVGKSSDVNASQYTSLEKGAKGDLVILLQTRLEELGFYTISIDGDYGNGTVKAVEKFQRFNSIEVTGVASPETQALLFSNDAKGVLNPNNRNRFIAQGKELFPFLSLASENGYSIDNPTRMGEVVFATASNDVNDYPICYFVESQKVYSVSVIERKQGDIKKDGYIECVVAMAKSLNYKAVDEEVREAVQLAIANPGIGAMNMANDMQFIYEADEGMLTISY